MLRYDELVSGATIYAYVGNNPLTYIDPLGLTRWTVGVFSIGGGEILEGGYVRYQAISQCVHGKQTVAEGNVLFGGTGIGLPIGFSGSTVEVDDGIPGNLDSSVFNGRYVSQGANVTFGAGVSYGAMRFGQAATTGYSWGAQGGFGEGASSDIGKSWITSSATFNVH